MQKTGNTSFVFESLEIEMDDDIFVPIGQLNALRRDALHALEEKLLADTGRIGMAVKPESHKSDIGTRNVRTADIHTADFFLQRCPCRPQNSLPVSVRQMMSHAFV